MESQVEYKKDENKSVTNTHSHTPQCSGGVASGAPMHGGCVQVL